MSEGDFVEEMYDDFMEAYFSKELMISPHAIPPAPDRACMRCLEVLPLERAMPVCEHMMLCASCDDEMIEKLRNPEIKEAVSETICANFCMVCRKKEEDDYAYAHQKMWDDYDAMKYKMQSAPPQQSPGEANRNLNPYFPTCVCSGPPHQVGQTLLAQPFCARGGGAGQGVANEIVAVVRRCNRHLCVTARVLRVYALPRIGICPRSPSTSVCQPVWPANGGRQCHAAQRPRKQWEISGGAHVSVVGTHVTR